MCTCSLWMMILSITQNSTAQHSMGQRSMGINGPWLMKTLLMNPLPMKKRHAAVPQHEGGARTAWNYMRPLLLPVQESMQPALTPGPPLLSLCLRPHGICGHRLKSLSLDSRCHSLTRCTPSHALITSLSFNCSPLPAACLPPCLTHCLPLSRRHLP